MLKFALQIIDWFVPASAQRNKSEFGRARNFVFTHLCGPLIAAPILPVLAMADQAPLIPCAIIGVSMVSFVFLPLVLRSTGDLALAAMLSVQNLLFVTLFGSFFYGGVSSPFLPWLLVALLLGFFYLEKRPVLTIAIFLANIAGFLAAFLVSDGAGQRISVHSLSQVGIISVMSATAYVAWMAIYYGRLLTTEAEIQKEVERHRETSERLRATKELAEQADRETSIFLAKMSHELRTPLNAVIGYSEMLLENAENAAPNERTRDLQKINAAGRHLLSLVTDVLDLSNIESRLTDVCVEEFELEDLINDCVATIKPLIDQNNCQMRLAVDTRLGRVSSDAKRIRQILLNLLSNAGKFTQNGIVELRCWRVANAAGDWIEIDVRDTGVGIAEHDLPMLFSDFSQARSVQASERLGTGLGLALSQRLAGALGGAITVKSKLGAGSCFHLRIPAILNSQSGPPPSLSLKAAA